VSVQFTYSGDPSTKPVDAVRFYCGDTDSKRPLLDDREVEFAIAQKGDSRLAAALCCDALAAKFSSIPDTRVGEVDKKWGAVAAMFAERAKELRKQARLFAGVSFPATHIATKQALEENGDLTRPSFVVGQGDNPFALQLSKAGPWELFNGW
jgi:hypothetical protein